MIECGSELLNFCNELVNTGIVESAYVDAPEYVADSLERKRFISEVIAAGTLMVGGSIGAIGLSVSARKHSL